MPNIIVELSEEIVRVRALLPKLDAMTRRQAQNAIEFANSYMSLNSLDGMRDVLVDLREFHEPKKGAQE